VVNPDSWLTGSALFTYVMLANPQVTASYSADVYDPFIEQGRSIQKFFRSLAFDERGKLQRVLIANMLRMYEQKMRDAAVAFESYLKVLPQLPLKSLDQELPEEIVSDEERARVAEATHPFAGTTLIAGRNECPAQCSFICAGRALFRRCELPTKKSPPT
jgi:hypothetical protein